MSFRARLSLVAAAAVALAILTASFVIYFVVRDQLRATVDDSLQTTAGQLETSPVHDFEHFGTPAGEIGGATVYPQGVDASGKVYLPNSPNPKVALPVSNDVIAVARGERGAFFSDTHVRKTHLRMLTFPYGTGGAVQVARSLTEVDHSLGRIKNLLILIAGGGIAIAAALGLAVSRAALAPVRRLTTATENVTETGDLSDRIEVSGRDELSRLARQLQRDARRTRGVLARAAPARRGCVARAANAADEPEDEHRGARERAPASRRRTRTPSHRRRRPTE